MIILGTCRGSGPARCYQPSRRWGHEQPRRASGCGEFVPFLVRSMKLGFFLHVVFVNLVLADDDDDVQ